MSVCNNTNINYDSIDIDLIMRNSFTNDTNCLYKILTRYIELSSFNVRVRDEFKKDMPLYMLSLINNHCYDCASICILNEYLKRWRVYINNNDDLVGFRYDILNLVSEAKKSINERFVFMGDKKYWYLCGCSDEKKMYSEDTILQEYIKNNKDNSSLEEEEFEREHKLRMSWRTNFYTELYKLDQHIKYYKKTPHKVYRGTVLFGMIKKTNMDCSMTILEYL